jgi:hypothetical protein
MAFVSNFEPKISRTLTVGVNILGVAAGIRFDVLVYAEKVRGIIFLFDGGQA